MALSSDKKLGAIVSFLGIALVSRSVFGNTPGLGASSIGLRNLECSLRQTAAGAHCGAGIGRPDTARDWMCRET